MPNESILNYYSNYDENGRLFKNQAHQMEFITTTEYLKKYLQEKKKILEIGAATGQYTFVCAKFGTDITALELSKDNVSKLRQKCQDSELKNKITVLQGDGKDLTRFGDNSFDIVLNMGPIYHLRTNEEKIQTVTESLRVLKRNGLLFLAYLSKYAVFYNQISRNPENIDWNAQNNVLELGCSYNDPRDVFFFISPTEIVKILDNFDIQIEKHLATDGISHLLPEMVNKLDSKSYKTWMKYHLRNCEDPTLLGYSIHNLLIIRKL